MATDPSTPSDDISAAEGGAYTPGPNRYPGGGTTVEDVTPLEDRSDGTSDAALEQQASITRQLPS